MKINKLLIIFSAVASIFVSNISTPVIAETNQIRESSSSDVQWTNDDFGDYYEPLFESSSSTLSSNLTTLITSTHKTLTTYDGLLSVFNKADVDPNNSNNILWFYTGTSVSKPSNFSGSTNREHVWPKDGGDAFPEKSGPGADGHHLRPTDSQLNSTRGSLSFGEVPQTTSNIVKQNGSTSYGKTADELCYKSGSFFYPAKGYRGQTARIIFYMASRWGSQYNLKMVSGAGNCKTIGDLPTLLKWNLEEPVCETEVFRNNEVAKIQGNRNPFIDNPHLACAIWGSNYSGCSNCNSIVNPYDGDVVLPDNPSSGGNGDSGSSGNTGNDTGTTTPTNYGSANSPLTVAQVKTICDGLSSGAYSAEKGYVTGVVKTEPILNQHGSYEFYLEGGSTEFMVYSAKLASGVSVPKIGDTVVVNGYFKIHNGVYEVAYISAINDSPSIISVNSSSTPSIPDTPTPDNPDDGDNQGGSTSTVTTSISFDFNSSNIASTSYTKGKTVTIDGNDYYFSDIFAGDNNGSSVVRLGNKNSSNAIQELGLSGYGSYLKPMFDLENCSSIEIEIKQIYSGTETYNILFQEKNSSTYTLVKEGTLSGGTTINASLSTPKTGRFILVITGSKARADLGLFTICTAKVNVESNRGIEDINLDVSTSSDSSKSYLKFSGLLNSSHVSGSTRYGILVFSSNQLGINEIKDLYEGGNLASFKTSISKYSVIDYEFTNNSLGNGTTVTAIVNNVKGHEDFSFTAVGYVEINGTVFFTQQVTSSFNQVK